MLIHISGPSGSGKTTMLDAVHTWSVDNKIAVKLLDIDDMTPGIYRAIADAGLSGTQPGGKMFEEMLTAAICDATKSTHINVICGLLDTYIAGELCYARIEPDYKFYIKIGDKKLLAQYLSRMVAFLQSSKNHVHLWCGNVSVMFDKNVLLQWKEETRVLYCDMLNYETRSYVEILGRVRRLIKKEAAVVAGIHTPLVPAMRNKTACFDTRGRLRM